VATTAETTTATGVAGGVVEGSRFVVGGSKEQEKQTEQAEQAEQAEQEKQEEQAERTVSTSKPSKRRSISAFTCPITQTMMNDPATTCDGMTY